LKLKEARKFIVGSIVEIYDTGEADSIALVILEHLGFNRQKLLRNTDGEIDCDQEKFIRQAIKELRENCPVQYILGETEFLGMKFILSRDVLIPRQETEELVDLIIRENHRPGLSAIDLGTGSGCIAVAIAKGIPSVSVTATDITKSVLRLAEENAKLNGTEIRTVLDDMLETGITEDTKFDIIVSNPPYVRDLEKQFMHLNVLDYEPQLALFVRDTDPLVYYRAIAGFAKKRLKPKGKVYVEINENFGLEVARIFSAEGIGKPEIIQDIRGKNRFVKVNN
jgi:release factor glutamine methyltransferase